MFVSLSRGVHDFNQNVLIVLLSVSVIYSALMPAV